MRGWSVLLVALLSISVVESSKCKQRYYESRSGREGFVQRRGCRGLDTLIPEEYWTTVGYDGQLRDGRSLDDFLTFPLEQNNDHRQRNSYVGYWITRSKYGDNRHYEAFGHVQVKPDGRVCGWFVGLNQEAVEVCGGFRVLSKNRHNPSEPIPFEWVQGPHLRNRDTLGFHHHRIAKYAQNDDEIFFGDAQIKKKTFQGIAPENERFVEVTSPSDFESKVWLLKKKSLSLPPQDQRPPVNIVAPRRNQDVDIYSDPHSEARIEHMRLYPYYDQYGRPSGDSSNSARPAYDAYGRRVPFEVQQPSSNQYQPVISSNEAPVSPGQPGYADWLRRQYAARGQIPIGGDPGYEEFYRQYKPVQQSSSNQDFAQRNGQEPSSAYEVSQASGGSPGAVNYNTDFGGRRPGDPGYQRPKFYVNPQNGDAVPVPYSVGSGSQPATGRIGEGVQPDYRSNNFGSGVQPGQPGYDSSATGSNSIGNGAQPASADYTREVQPGQADYRSNIGRGAQPGNLIGSGAQPGQPGYDDRIPNSQIDFAGQPGSDERVRNIQPGHPNYRSNARAIGSGAQPGQSIGSGVQPGDSGSGSGSGYNNNIGHGVQPGSDGYNDDRRQQGGNGIGNGAEPNDISIPYNNQDGRAPNGQNYNIGSGADGRSAQDSDERYRNYDVYGRPLNPSNVVLPAPQNAGQQNFKLAKFRPRTIVRDSNGNFYEQRVENGKIYFYSDPHTGEEQKRIEIAELEPKISEELEGRRRQEANLRQLIENSRRSGEAPVQPISAAQKARRSSKTAQDQFFF